MKNLFVLFVTAGMIILLCSAPTAAQDGPISPSIIKTGVYLGLTPPLKDFPIITEEEFQQMVLEADKKQFNEKFRERSFPYASTALPKGPDPVWQKEMGTPLASREAALTFDGLTSPYWPSDANGDVGYNYYMQTINCVFAIYDKATGAQVAGPSFMNYLFYGKAGSECNSGDPIVLYDDQADRWLAAEFSICGENDYMLIAVSQTGDPTGSWHKYSFDVDDMPDYPKFGIWHDGYYMGTNNGLGDDIYVFERDKMLEGLSAQMVGFNNQWRPGTVDGFHWLLPLDNDGIFNQTSHGMFITINDDAIGGGSDQLWIYELDVNWDTINASFNRILQLDVDPFDSNFGQVSNGISQPKPGKLLDAIPNGLMHRAQYRKFDTYEAIVCCHTVDVNGTDFAGIRWYELRRKGGDWSVWQSGTFAPDDGLSRWMGSIAMNANNEIGLGYSVSSISEYPGIRYCGQSADKDNYELGVMNIEESVIHSGAYSQGVTTRWGDYFNMAIDPLDEQFWFTAQYIGSTGHRNTKIATFGFSDPGLNANFLAAPIHVWTGNSVSFTDKSSGDPTTWDWTFENGTPASSTEQNPTILYDTAGTYDVSLTVNDNVGGSNTKTINGYITVEDDQYLISHGNAVEEWINSIGCPGHRTCISGSSGEVGYQDLMDLTFNLEAGNSYSFQFRPGFSGRSQSEYWRMWIDFNQDDDFDETNELVMAANRKKGGFSTTVNIPSEVPESQTRMRLSMKRGSAPMPDEVFDYGEVEDFTVNIAGQAPQPPVANFTADKTTISPGETVYFTDLSTNNPTSWSWLFPGGVPSESDKKDPNVMYPNIGWFDVTLTATNSVGSNVLTETEYIYVTDDPVTTYCEPVAINNSLYFIDDITIGSNTGVSGQGSSGYTYYNEPVFTLIPGNTTATLTPNNNKRKFFWRIWLDANNNGDFVDEGETLFALDNVKGSQTGPITIPDFTDPGRLRISMRTGTAPTPCDDNFPGEVEDYDVIPGSRGPLSQIEERETMVIELYPNPVSGSELHLKVSISDSPVSIRIYDKNGKLIDNLQTVNEHSVINIAEYNSGVYFVKVSVDDHVVVKKFVKIQ